MKIIFVGEAPGGRPNEDERPLAGRAGKFLAKLAGKEGVIPDHFETVNLLSYYPGTSGKGSNFVASEAKVKAEKLLTRLDGNEYLILLGRRVAGAFGQKDLPYFKSKFVPPCWVVVIPHPSGINRVWNDPKTVKQARIFLGSLSDS